MQYELWGSPLHLRRHLLCLSRTYRDPGVAVKGTNEAIAEPPGEKGLPRRPVEVVERAKAVRNAMFVVARRSPIRMADGVRSVLAVVKVGIKTLNTPKQGSGVTDKMVTVVEAVLNLTLLGVKENG